MSIAADVADAAIKRNDTVLPAVLVEVRAIPEQRQKQSVVAIVQMDTLQQLAHGAMVHEGLCVQNVVDTQTSK